MVGTSLVDAQQDTTIGVPLDLSRSVINLNFSNGAVSNTSSLLTASARNNIFVAWLPVPANMSCTTSTPCKLGAELNPSQSTDPAQIIHLQLLNQTSGQLNSGDPLPTSPPSPINAPVNSSKGYALPALYPIKLVFTLGTSTWVKEIPSRATLNHFYPAVNGVTGDIATYIMPLADWQLQ